MKYQISGKEDVLFNNNTFYCIGTGRMGLALQQKYLEQLEFVQKEIGFEHIRGHGLFSDDMAIYHEYQEGVPMYGPHAFEGWDEKKVQVEYNWTYLDMVMDSYR
ncbi:MAG: hypothetical protein J6W46_10555, partial [Spirochaetaceae bacterium]|nr:hypothetical protein [Spirochaetaceae bacterium]